MNSRPRAVGLLGAVLGAGLGSLACGVPPVIDAGEYVAIASDDPDAACPGSALALDRMVAYHAQLLGVDLDGFGVTVFLVSADEIERRCNSADALGCLTDEGERVWVRDQFAAPFHLARAVVNQQLGLQHHDFIDWGMGEALAGSSSYASVPPSGLDALPSNLRDLSSRPGVSSVAGRFFAAWLRDDPEGMRNFLRAADDASAGSAESDFESEFGIPFRDAVDAWYADPMPGCSYGVSACSGVDTPYASVSPWRPSSASCEAGEVLDLGTPTRWISVQLPESANGRCTLRADLDLKVYACGGCSTRDDDWQLSATVGQWRSIDDLPAGERIAIEARGEIGEIYLDCN